MIENSDNQVSKKYWREFDFVKGILIILVFMGHIIPGVIRETYPRYLIYSFHMPLFIGVSGFLLNIEKLNTKPLNLIKKYWKRMICPWIIAVALYFMVRLIMGKQSLSIKSIIAAYIHPYYHLWYVLGFLSYLVIACVLWKVFKNSRYKWIWIFILSTIISVVSRWKLLSYCFSDGILSQIYECIHYDFRLYNLIFFIIGVYLRNRFENVGDICSPKIMEGIRVFAIIAFTCVAILFFFDYTNVENTLFFVMNSSLLAVVIFDCVNYRLPKSKIIEFLGRYSLPIYLYHIMCKLVALLFCVEGSASYYVVSVVLYIIGCILIFFLRRVGVINTVFFGSTTSSLNAK